MCFPIKRPRVSNECIYTDVTTSVDGVRTKDANAGNVSSAGINKADIPIVQELCDMKYPRKQWRRESN
ncbi:hypothetical protein Tco_0861806 [Tanacetum coccineum]